MARASAEPSRRSALSPRGSRQLLHQLHISLPRGPALREAPRIEAADLVALDRPLLVAVVDLLAQVIAQLVRQHGEEPRAARADSCHELRRHLLAAAGGQLEPLVQKDEADDAAELFERVLGVGFDKGPVLAVILV